ncbi:MAG: MoaD/ThiS family protein [Pseudomonadales bacterium]|jgi:molybdopterin synthase sulfur carrier subunit|nr:MoaD/ThiS family protein [Pseudomonadales bacterium]MDA0760551.1 MoaD/ThiS family protein [Pseudomonadota bacterium]MDA0958456.1 MoaD/ThiS family protein [Pseudomonadota bacterium]MDA1206935.1 MoaD/ThiS family protein [Pseudomonadota bacterium]
MEVQLSGFLSSAAGGVQSVELTGETVGELLTSLELRYPSLRDAIEQGVAVAVNGEIYRDRRDQPIPPGAEVFLLPRLAGG